jgi:hypothetical protein
VNLPFGCCIGGVPTVKTLAGSKGKVTDERDRAALLGAFFFADIVCPHRTYDGSAKLVKREQVSQVSRHPKMITDPTAPSDEHRIDHSGLRALIRLKRL